MNNSATNPQISAILSKLKDIKIYCVEYGNEDDVDKQNYYIDKNEAIKDYDTVTINDFDDPLCSSNYKILQYTSVDVNLIEEFINDNYDEDSDYDSYISELEYCDLEDYCNPHDDFTHLKYHSFEQINSNTDEMIEEVISELNLNGKYTRLNYIDEDGEDYDIQIRVADHSWNINNNNCCYNFSFVIANENVTRDKFFIAHDDNSEQFYFSENDSVDDICFKIKQAINSRIDFLNLKPEDEDSTLIFTI